MTTRCPWALTNALMTKYHDSEWGIPVHDDRKLFEFLILEGAQAGLSWNTILQKRQNYRQAFNFFDPAKIALYEAKDSKRLLADQGIVRNRLKIKAAIQNARAFLKVQKEFGTFDSYIWGFTRGKTIVGQYKTQAEVPCRSGESDAMSRDLRGRGFNFVGSVICYSFMQAVGMADDHLKDCFRYKAP